MNNTPITVLDLEYMEYIEFTNECKLDDIDIKRFNINNELNINSINKNLTQNI